jgi:hypothetical protein
MDNTELSLNDNSVVSTVAESSEHLEPEEFSCQDDSKLNNVNNDTRLGFSLLFTYDYLHYTHTCICA